ncbi:MAG: glycogen debranching enzyme, partial [Nostoc sp.]
SALRRSNFFTGEVNDRGLADIAWHGCKLFKPGWHDSHARVLGFTLGGFEGEADIHVMLNMYWEDLDFEIPSIKGRKWCRVVDTALPSPIDIAEPGEETVVSGDVYSVKERSVVVLISK